MKKQSQRNSKISEFEEEKNVRVLIDKAREQRVLYIKYRKVYTDELERSLSCAYFQNRLLNQYEKLMLEKYYHQYFKAYCDYLLLREKLSIYTKMLNWLEITK